MTQVGWIMVVWGSFALLLQLRTRFFFDGRGLIRRAAEVSPYGVDEIEDAADLVPCRYRERGRRRVALLDYSKPSKPILFTASERLVLPSDRVHRWSINPTIGRTLIQFSNAGHIPSLDVPHSMLARLPEDVRFYPFWRSVLNRLRHRRRQP